MYLECNHNLIRLHTPKEILTLILQRDEKGIEILYDQYASSLYGIIVRIIPDKQAEEVLQKTMLKIWDGIESYNASVSSFYTWMSVIARNTAIDQRRLKSFRNKEKTISIDTIVYQETVETKSGANIDVGRLLESMDKKQRIVLEYAYLRGYTHQEIADVLELPLGTVKTRIRKAIHCLREELKDERNLFLGGFILLVIIIISVL